MARMGLLASGWVEVYFVRIEPTGPPRSRTRASEVPRGEVRPRRFCQGACLAW